MESRGDLLSPMQAKLEVTFVDSQDLLLLSRYYFFFSGFWCDGRRRSRREDQPYDAITVAAAAYDSGDSIG